MSLYWAGQGLSWLDGGGVCGEVGVVVLNPFTATGEFD